MATDRRALLLVAVLPLALTSIAAGNTEAPGTHCSVQVMGEDADGNFILAPEVCSNTFADALARLGAADVDADITPASVDRSVLLLLNILAVHYENANYGGSSFIIWGTTCTGGGLNLSSQWNDRISSTAHGVCNQVRHYEHKDYQGAVFTTWHPGGNITGVMNDKTSSITYPS